MSLIACTAMANWPVIKQVAFLLGYVMRGIYMVLDVMGIHSIALCVILFTIITRMLLMPLTMQQQKFSKLTAVMQPELQAIQAKYKNKKDNVSVQRMNVETQMVYEKYGVNMSAGCLPSLLQIVLLFALYPVIYQLEKYIPQLASLSPEALDKMYTMWGIIKLKETPTLGVNVTVLIPILAALSQFISTQLMMKMQPQQNSENAMASSMKTMNYMMPLMSLWFCFSFPCFIGIYWIMMSVVMIVQQIYINHHFSNIDVDQLVKENIEKQNKKRAKKGLPPLASHANMSTKNIDSEIEKRMAAKGVPQTPQQRKMSVQELNDKVKNSTEYYQKNTTAKPGSLAAKAGMVKAYNEKHNK